MADITVSVSSPGSLTTWGQGFWDNGAWGQGTGVIAETGDVTIDAEISVGWGGDSWNENAWGELSITYAPVTTAGLLQTYIGDEEYAGTTTGWGRPSWGTKAWGISGTLLADGQAMTSSVGSVTIDAELNVGWGRAEWGNGGWGVRYSAVASGQALTSSIGNESVTTDVDVTVTTAGLLSFAAIGTYSIQIDSDVSVVQAGENLLNISQGSFS